MRKPRLMIVATLVMLALGLLRFAALQAQRPAAQRALLHLGRGVVRVAVTDLLAAPGAASAVVDQAVLGETLAVLGAGKDSGAFVQVETRARYRGFVSVDALAGLPAGAPPYDQGGPVARVVSRFANLYGQPDLTVRGPLLVAPLGVRLRLEKMEKDDGRWLAVMLPDLRRAYVQRGDVDLGPPPRLDAACVTGQALAYAGTPYLWGGRSTYGIDCSGLVSNALIACGLLPPRDADQQFAWDALRPVPPDPAALLPGDLLFFGSPGPSGPRVTHVGIALGGDLFVHATTQDRPTVHQSHLLDPPWQQLLVGVRRHPGINR